MPSNFFTIFLFLTAFLLKTEAAGHISNWDYSVDYTNTGYMTSLSFGLSLENGMQSSDYIKIIFPFALHTSAVISNSFTVSLKLVGTSGCTPIQTTSTNVFLSPLGANTYYIQFLDEKGEINKPLISHTWYILIFQMKSPLTINKGNYPPVQIYSVSSMSDKAIIYDYNIAFANIEITDAPSLNSLAFTSSITSTTFQDIDAIFDSIFDIVPSVDIDQARVFISMTKNDWLFNGEDCISVDQNVTTTLSNGTVVTTLVEALNSSLFTCLIDSVTNMAVISFKTKLLASTHYIFSVSIRNPKYVVQNGGFEVRSLLKNSNTIIERTIGSTTFSINPLNWGSANSRLKILLGWGVDKSQSSLPPQFTFFRGSNSLTPFKFYNAIKFVFSPSYETGTGVMLKIILRLDAETGFEVLSGSIAENLPDYGNEKVYCALDSTPTLNKITCYNVGLLSNLSNYHIGLKAYFPYSATNANLNSNFGMISIYTYNPKLLNYDTLALINAGRCGSITYTTINNLDNALTSNPTYCYTMAHSQTAGSISSVNTANCGIKTDSEFQNLVFTFTATPAQIYSGAFNTFAGFSIYTTRFIQESTTYDATDPIKDGNSIATDSTNAGDNLEARAGHDYSTGKKWTWFKIYAMDTGSFAAFQNSLGAVFGVKNIKITSLSGNYAEENCFDFYIATYNNIEGTTPVLTNIFAFNSYSISSTYIGKSDNTGLIKLAIANFWTGTSGQGSIIGDKFPIFIRIIGYIEPAYMSNVKKLGVFFDNLDYFSSYTENSIDVVDCSSSLESKTKCYGYKGQTTSPLLLNSLHSLNRIEIDVESLISGTSKASPFQILIPMKSIENVGSINLQFATLTTDYFYGIYKPYTTIMNTFNTFYRASFTSKTWASVINTAVITNINYMLSFSTGPAVGQVAYPSPAIINCGHDDANPSSPLVDFNQAPYYGAGFTYISDYNMISNGFLGKGSWINTQITSERCLQFSYTYTTIKKYGFFCPFSLNSISASTYLTALNFIFPYENGQRIVDNTYGLWSDNTGDLISYQWHDNTGGLELFTAGFITLINGGMTPALYKGINNQKIQWTFQTTNPIPIDGKVKITFAASIWSFSLDSTEKCYLKASLLANDRYHSCTISQVTNQYIIFSFSPSTTDLSPFPAGSYSLIQYGVDKDGNNGLTLSFTIQTMTINSYLIDQSSNLAGKMIFNNGQSNYQLLISNVVLQTRTIGFRDSFKFQFSVSEKTIFFNEIVEINLGSLATQSLTSQVIFSIYEGNTLSFDWISVDFTQLTSIKLTPSADITTLDKVYTVIVEGIYIPTSNLQGLSLKLLHKTTNVLVSTTYAYPTFIAPYNQTLVTPNITFYKNFDGYGERLELTFEIILGNNFTSQHTALIILPIQYNSQGYCSCRINDLPVSCYYPRNHAIIIESTPVDIPQDTPFNLTIYGIINPKITVINAQTTFLIGFNQSSDANRLTIFGEVPDVLAQVSSISSLNILMGEITDSYVLEQTTMKFQLDYFQIDILTTYFLVFDLLDSESYRNIALKAGNLSCQLINDSNINLISKCELKGLRIHFTLNDMINSSNLHTLIINNLPNPEYINCNIRKPSLTVLYPDYKTVLYRTNPTTANIPTLYTKANSSMQYTSWTDAQGTSLIHGQNVLEITIGMYSPLIYLVPDSKPFFKFMGLEVFQPSGVKFWPSLLQGEGIKIGDKKYGLRIGCPSNISQQILDFLVNKIEPKSDYYSNFEQISLSLLKKQYAIQPLRFTYSIANLGRALPVIFDFTENCPYNYLLINFTIVNSGAEMGHIFESTQSPTKICNVTSENPIVKLQALSTQNNSVDYINYGQIIFSFLGGDVDSYTISPSPIILYTVDVANTSIPALSIIYNALSTHATQQEIIVETSDTSTIYCYVSLSLSDGISRDFNYTRKSADDGYQLNPNDRYQEQFLAFYIEEFTVSYTFTIQKLKAKKTYNFICWAMNLLQIISSPVSGKFTNADNGGKLMRFGLTFAGELSGPQKQEISCFLCTYFALPCEKVQSFDNYYCQYKSYLDLLVESNNTAINETNSTVITNNTNTTTDTTINTTTDTTINTTTDTAINTTTNTAINTTNTTINTTDTTTNTTNTTVNTTNTTTNTTNTTNTTINTANTSNNTVENVSINTVYTSINFYFMPLDDEESDSSFNNVTEETQSPIFQTYLKGNLTGFPNISYIQPISEVSEIDPAFDSTMEINSTIDGNWVYITGFKMNSRGFILLSIELDVDLRSNVTNTTEINTNTTETNSTTNNTINDTLNTSNQTADNTTNSSTSTNTSTDTNINIFGRRLLVENSTNITNFLDLFKPSPAQIKLKIDAYNNSILLSGVSFYNYTDGSINITGLNYSTTYRIYYTASSENPAVYCLLGKTVLGMRVTTKDKYIQTTFSRIEGIFFQEIIILIIAIVFFA